MKHLYVLIMTLAILITACSGASELPQEDSSISSEVETMATATLKVTEAEIPPAESNPYSTEIIGGNEESLRKFLVYEVDGVYGSSAWGTIVSINSLPENIPVEIPVTDQMEVIGSIARAIQKAQSVAQNHNFYTIFMESDLSISETQEQYTQLLENEGWWAKPMLDADIPGFAPDQNDHKVFAYCTEDSNAFLEVNIFEISEDITTLRLDLDTEPDPGQCMQMNETESFDPVPGIYNLFPELKAPADAIVEDAGGARASFDNAETTSQINSTLSMETLLTHYNNQLKNANWEMISQTYDNETAWSRWTLKDDAGETWRGFFIIYDMSPENDSLRLSLQIFRGE